VRVLAFSDVHRDLDAAADLVARSADADLVIGAGDFASVHEGLEETVDALSGMQAPLVLVPGNNETEEALRAVAPAGAIVLHGEAVEEEGTSLWGLGAGIPTTPWDWSFDLSDDEAAERLKTAPQALDVMVLHSPPRGHCDQSGSGDHLGSQAIADAIEAKRPRVAVCGHIHESWGAESAIGETRIYNLGPQGRVIEI
jgi:Icc-related predicted phosphoesterase